MVEPADRVLPWASHTLTTLRALAAIPDTGVRLATGREIATTVHDPPAWATLLPDRRPCPPEELPDGYTRGVRYTAPIIDMPIYLRYLTQRLRTAGGHIEIGAVTAIADILDEASIIVCCAGIGARTLAQDDSLYPIRGQHLVVTNPGLTDFLEADTGDSPELTAIYPHPTHVILAGTAEPNAWSRQPDQASAERIRQRCTAIEPRLADTRILEHRVGLRPTRPHIRLTAEHHDNGILIHNYGHGGAGVSLSWGCAAEVRQLADPG
jgi:D-amino-acid oxidase